MFLQDIYVRYTIYFKVLLLILIMPKQKVNFQDIYINFSYF